MSKQVIKALVDAGKATAGPPLGPQLGPLGVNVGKLIADINAATKDFEGMKVPVEIIVDTKTKTWEIKVGSPPVSQLIKKELGIEKGSGKALKEPAGDISREVIVKIARIKLPNMNTKSLAKAVKTVLGTCVSMGITVEGKDPRYWQKAIDSGEWKIEE